MEEEMKLSEKVKHPGIVFDSKLIWNQMLQKINARAETTLCCLAEPIEKDGS